MNAGNADLRPWQHAVSGAIAGICSRIAIAPLDVIKIRLQLQSEKISRKGDYSGILGTSRIIYSENGLFGFWKGNLPAMYLYLSYGAVQFYAYSQIRSTFNNTFSENVTTFLSGATAGCLATTLTYPFDLLRTRFAAQGEIKIYRSIYNAFVDIYAQEKFRGFYHGLSPALLQIIPYMGIMFSAHNFIKNELTDLLPSSLTEFVAGGAAGILSKSVAMPLDVIRKRYQVQGPQRNSYAIMSIPNYQYLSIYSTARRIVLHEGISGLYKGLVPSILKTAPLSAITFLMVDLCSSFFRRLNQLHS